MPAIDFTNLRVFIDENVHQIYTDLTSGAADRAEDAPFAKMPDLFVAAACYGANAGVFKPIEGKKRDIFVADALNQTTQIPSLIALAYRRVGNLEELVNAKTILTVCEGWANGGIHLLRDQLYSGNGLRPLYRLVDGILR